MKERLIRWFEAAQGCDRSRPGFKTNLRQCLRVKGSPVQCDLCSRGIRLDEFVWTCARGTSSMYHMNGYDMCYRCVMSHALDAQQDAGEHMGETLGAGASAKPAQHAVPQYVLDFL